MTTDDSSHFSRESARERFLSTYDDLLRRLWPVPVQAEDIPTAAGTVRVYRSGPAGDDPVVLLAGAGGNALGWHPCVAALSNSRPVIAVDPLGEPGRSVQTQPIPDAAGAIRWLDDVLVAVDARRAHLVGSSYGGWLALEYERVHPGRVAAVTLVDPAGLEPLSGRFYRWVILGGMASLLPAALRRRTARPLHNGTLADDDLMRLVRASLRFRRRVPPPTIWTDDELSAVHAPVQLLLGARSAIHDAARVAERLSRVVPEWRLEVVPDNGHALPVEAPDLVADRVLAFQPTGSPAEDGV